MRVRAYIFREAGLRTTSFGMLASGVLGGFGSVLRNGGGNPEGKVPAKEEFEGADALPGVVLKPGSIPAARKRSRRELGSGTGVEVVGGGRDCWYRG